MTASRRWDIFCQVIDNHGDLGVCWRLARQLVAEGESVRLWVDDASALAWMAPDGPGAVRLVRWGDAADEARALTEAPPEVLIEAFGCEPAPALVAQFAARARTGAPHAWINLEYLSAETQVERLHGLQSPVFSGPGAGLSKHFFYPGFTAATGGLLCEADLAARQAAFDREGWLARHVPQWSNQRPQDTRGERVISLFCYEPAGLAALLQQLSADATPTRLLVTPGRPAAAVRALLGDTAEAHGSLRLHFLPALSQPDYDHLLWACDLNFVRGEDSWVRAHWADAPLVWQIYPQDDDAHHAKLQAWLDWRQAPDSLRRLHRAWNGVGDEMPQLSDANALREWHLNQAQARDRLRGQADLLTQLRGFIARKS
ncbi:MAG: elongation factor P maturation arginine rhamnosyltransferase EarP [Comamonadaceae bacterium]|nr:MAG: elongation factor P maturation arginine rhamnosyltransferase EarP [Comamonadaceae bacterium]